MKKIIVLFSFLCLVLTSCSSNENDASDISDDLIGTWIGTDIVYEGRVETSFLGELIKTEFTGEGYDITTKLTFNESPKTIVSEGSYSVKIDYTVDGGVESTEVVEDIEFLENGEWELEGDEIIVENSSESYYVKIFLLTSNELVVGITEIEETEENGIEIRNIVKAIASFKR
ncbi:lipocalin family protein [Tamlana agarivorans]|uniref:Lipocalin family protein n=1 Tax=Pseudotamlana agarivorans TaxID=481183 RepID=A0ACC5UBJ3_9FLAO|nr:lipocalin family protein [Tamlana agarivorans]MBU2951703.1 lipocalin family protein [Tamlana agarivorans]